MNKYKVQLAGFYFELCRHSDGVLRLEPEYEEWEQTTLCPYRGVPVQRKKRRIVSPRERGESLVVEALSPADAIQRFMKLVGLNDVQPSYHPVTGAITHVADRFKVEPVEADPAISLIEDAKPSEEPRKKRSPEDALMAVMGKKPAE